MMMFFASWRFYLPTGISVFGAGELIPGDFGFIMQFGALGILGVAVWRLLDELKEARKERLAHDKTRHDDHLELNRTLLKMTSNCSAVNSQKRGEAEE